MKHCANCSLSKRLDLGGEVVLYTPRAYLLNRLQRLTKEGVRPQTHHSVLTLDIEHFREFIVTLPEQVQLSPAEEDMLMIAHLAQGEGYGPDILGKTRTYAQWRTVCGDDPILNIIKQERLVTYFQPIVDLGQNQVFGYECLNRGLSQDGSVVSPNLLLDSARRADMLFNLDFIMRKQSLISAKEQGIDAHIFINFVPTAVYNPEFCLKTTIDWVSRLEISPSQLVFEVVETEKMEDADHLIRILEHYRKQGFKIALDDVAAGYSGLLQLLTLRPDIMKIDRAVVDGIHADDDKQALLKAMLTVAADYGIKPLAEGIEEMADLMYLREQGIDLVQGYLFGKPGPEPITPSMPN